MNEECQTISHRGGLSIRSPIYSDMIKEGFGISFEDGGIRSAGSFTEERVDAYLLSFDTLIAAETAVDEEVYRYLAGGMTLENVVDVGSK